MSAEDQIKSTVEGNDVVLFMKGTKTMPQCGFSSRVAGVLNFMGIEYSDVNVLEDEGIRQGIKDFSDWPTIPQLYVKGEFVGGCDIITEMTLSGELDQLFDDKGVAISLAPLELVQEMRKEIKDAKKRGRTFDEAKIRKSVYMRGRSEAKKRGDVIWDEEAHGALVKGEPAELQTWLAA